MGSSSNESNSLIVCNMKYLAILAIALSPSWPPSPKPRLMPKLPPPTMVDTTAVDTDMVTDTVLDTADTMVDTTAMVSSPEPQATNTFLPLPPPTVSLKSTNDLLMLNPKQRLMPKLLPHTTVDTTAVDTDTVTDTTVLDTVDT